MAGPPPIDLTHTPDAEFLSLCESTIAIEEDLNVKGQAKSQRGAVAPDYRPIAGLEAIPCHPVLRERALVLVPGSNQPIAAFVVRVLFPYPAALDLKHRIVFADPDRLGQPRYWYPQAGSEQPAQYGVYWRVDCYERLRSAEITPIG